MDRLYAPTNEGDLSDWNAPVVKAALVSRGTPWNNGECFLDSIEGWIVATAEVKNRTMKNGGARADDTTFFTVPSGDEIASVVVYVDTGDVNTSRLICALDRTNTPLNTNGGDITVKWNTSEGLFSFFASMALQHLPLAWEPAFTQT